MPYPGWKRDEANARVVARRRAGEPVFAGPRQVHARLPDGRYTAVFGAGKSYRPNPVSDPLHWEPVQVGLALNEVGDGWESREADAMVTVPLVSTGAFVVQARGWGALTQQFQGANEVPGVLAGPTRVVFEGAYTNTDLVVDVGWQGMKVDIVFTGPGHPTSFVVRETWPQGNRDGREVWDGQAKFQIDTPFWTDGDEVRVCTLEEMPGGRVRYTLPDMSDVVYPFTFDPTASFYPDADPETNTVDGTAERISADLSFSAIRSSAGNNSFAGGSLLWVGLRASTTTDQFQKCSRSYVLFDTTSLSGETVNLADLILYLDSKDTTLGDPDIDAVLATGPASDTNVVDADYAISNFTTGTVYGSKAVSTFTASADNTITLSPSAVVTDGVNLTRIGLITSWDTDNSFGGTWTSGVPWAFAKFQSADNTNAPELFVTYGSLNKVVSEALNMVEGTVKVLGPVKIVSEALNMVEGAVKFFGFAKVVNEVLNMVEGTVKVLGLRKIVNEVLNMVEGTKIWRHFRRVVNESLNMVEGTVKATVAVLVHIFYETLSATRTLTEAGLSATRRFYEVIKTTRTLK